MNPYLFVLALLASTLFSEGFSLATAADHDPKDTVCDAERPNVLLILVDDLKKPSFGA